MNSPEAFYLHISGTQRGPYTIPQIDHLLNSGLIAQETLYWREGLEQWEPVTGLVPVRKKPNPWKKPAWVLGVLLVLAIPVRIFGPVVLVGWHEANQHRFTTHGAYWRARDVVRNHAVPPGALVDFANFAAATVELHPPDRAEVVLRGALTEASGQVRPTTWKVAMEFNAGAKEWSGAPIREAAAPR